MPLDNQTEKPCLLLVGGGKVGGQLLKRFVPYWHVVLLDKCAETLQQIRQWLNEEQTPADGYRLLEGDATSSLVLAEADIEKADAVVVTTGNDWRAIEAGAHAYAVRDGAYGPLSHWERGTEGDLVGTLELPLAVGTVGGATRVHPLARLALKILGVESARELAEVIAAVGLAQNLAALRALATEGIQRGHMELHARQVAIAAGAEGELVERVAEQMVQDRVIRPDRAEEILAQLELDVA